MKLITLRCPNCGASLEVDNGIDTFFCMHCGHKIVFADQNKETIKAKALVKRMEHEERLTDKVFQQERYKIVSEEQSKKRVLVFALVFWLLVMVVVGITTFIGNNGAAKQEQKLQAIVDEIMIDIESGNYASAYIKANSLYWESDWTSEGEEKWNSTRKTIIKQIQEAEKAETSMITYEEPEGNWFTDLFE